MPYPTVMSSSERLMRELERMRRNGASDDDIEKAIESFLDEQARDRKPGSGIRFWFAVLVLPFAFFAVISYFWVHWLVSR